MNCVGRRTFLRTLAALAGSATAATLVSGCDRPPSAPKAKVQRLGLLVPGEPRRFAEAFHEGLRQQGYVPGENLLVDVRETKGDFSRAGPLAEEIVALSPDVIVAGVPAEALAVRDAAARAGKSIPIVFSATEDPVAEGLVPALNRPGGSMTGLALPEPEIETKRLDILHQVLPSRGRVAFLADHDGMPVYARRAVELLQHACRSLDLRALFLRTDTPEALARALDMAAKSRVDAVQMIAMTPLFLNEHRYLIDFVTQHRLPTMYGDEYFVEQGGLMFYGASFVALQRKSAEQVARILRGARVADIPVERPTNYGLGINVKAAAAIGFTIPPSLMAQATTVIR